MISSLKEAQDLLNIKTIYLRNSFVKVNDEVDVDDLIDSKSILQSFKGVSKVREASFKNDEKSWWEYAFYYSIGIRIIEEDSHESENEDISPLVEIKATFCAKYESKDKLTQEHIDAFSESNVGFNTWPYWREFVQSSCMRLNIESIDVPLYFCSKA